ncbi:MAG: YjgB family protein [Bacillota bacterium]
MLKKLALVIFCLSLVVTAGCTAKIQTDTAKEPKSNTIMSDFRTLTEKSPSVEEVANFINNNIANVSKEDASKMVNEFEKIQKKNFPQIESMFAKDDIQNKINSEYKAITTQSDIKDNELKELLARTKNSGYKVETAEGFFFPIIDYGFYKKFSSYVTPDMKDYIDIMAEESDKVPAKDAALVIGWDEVLERALNQEKFINTYKDSVKANDIMQLYKKYVTFALYGLNNTPLFSYDTKTLAPKAREVYLNAVTNAGDSEFLMTLGGFLDLVRNNNYKLTNEAEKYRENVINKLGDSSLELSSSSPEQKEDSQAILLHDIMQLAQQGKVINCEFPIETTVIDTVKEKWGEPDQADYVAEAKGIYATYAKHNVVLGFNKGSQIFDVRSYDNRFKQVTMSKVKEVLGAPDNTQHFATEDMLVYKAGEKYQLLFLFPKATQQNPDPQLNHYNVFYPRGTVNLMADDPVIEY